MQPTDLEAVWTINQANTPAVGSLDLEALGRVVEQSRVALVVEQGSEILGFVICMAPDSTYSSPNFLFFTKRYARFLYICLLYTSPSPRD